MTALLDNIRVAAPCKASCDKMQGDERVRFCSQCRQHVYNLSEMHRDEAVSLIRDHEGRTCVRYFRRQDGTVLTRDCPVGLRAIRRHIFVACAAVGVLAMSVLFACFGVALSSAWERDANARDNGPRPNVFERVWNLIFPLRNEAVTGICLPDEVAVQGRDGAEEIPAPTRE